MGATEQEIGSEAGYAHPQAETWQYEMLSEWICQILHDPSEEGSSSRVVLHRRPVGAAGINERAIQSQAGAVRWRNLVW